MLKFRYKGINSEGKSVRDVISASSLNQAKKLLKEKKVFVESINEVASKKKTTFLATKKVKVEHISVMTRQLSTLIKANLPIVEAIDTVRQQIENPYLQEVLTQVAEEINEGIPLHKALGKHPHIFDSVYVSMVEAGEESGTLDVLLIRLAEFTEDQHSLLSKIKGAMLYPIIMFILTLLILGALFVMVIPKMVSIFDSTPELTLEWYTLAVIQISAFMVNQWPLIVLGMGFLFVLLNSWKSSSSGSKIWDRILLNLPIVGKIVQLIAISRFTRTLGTLLAGGVPILSSLKIVKNVVNNFVLASAIEQASSNIREGESIATPLSASTYFPPMVINMIRVGEKTGELEPALIQISDYYDFQVKNSLSSLTSIIEPLMIIFMGGIIGSIVFSIMLPIFQLSDLGG